MNELQTVKQKARLLRSHLEQAFKHPVTLAQAYEALAASEGTTWNVLSARLAATDDTLKKPLAKASPALPLSAPKTRHNSATPAKVRALFITGDSEIAAEFDAEDWLSWANKGRIAQLLQEYHSSPVEGFEAAFGGSNDLAKAIAHACSGNDHRNLGGMSDVYRYMSAKSLLNLEHGDSFCFVSKQDLLTWLKSHPNGAELLELVPEAQNDTHQEVAPVLDTDLDTPAQTSKMLEVCQTAWENAKQHWKSTLGNGGRCEYLIEHGDVLRAMADCDILASTGTDDEPEFAPEAVQAVLNRLEVLGYELHARKVFEGEIPLNEPMLGMATFGELAIGDWFRNVHSCTLYRKESENSVKAYKQVGAEPYSQSFRMGEDAVARVVKREAPSPR